MYEMATACLGRYTSTGHMTYFDEMIYESILLTYVELMIYESMLATYVDVMIYESTLENFETAFEGIVFAMVKKKVLHCRH